MLNYTTLHNLLVKRKHNLSKTDIDMYYTNKNEHSRNETHFLDHSSPHE